MSPQVRRYRRVAKAVLALILGLAVVDLIVWVVVGDWRAALIPVLLVLPTTMLVPPVQRLLADGPKAEDVERLLELRVFTHWTNEEKAQGLGENERLRVRWVARLRETRPSTAPPVDATRSGRAGEALPQRGYADDLAARVVLHKNAPRCAVILGDAGFGK